MIANFIISTGGESKSCKKGCGDWVKLFFLVQMILMPAAGGVVSQQ
jgi:hypothetical protein